MHTYLRKVAQTRIHTHDDEATYKTSIDCACVYVCVEMRIYTECVSSAAMA